MRSMKESGIWTAYERSLPDLNSLVASNEIALFVLLIQGLVGVCMVVVGCQQKRWN